MFYAHPSSIQDICITHVIPAASYCLCMLFLNLHMFDVQPRLLKIFVLPHLANTDLICSYDFVLLMLFLLPHVIYSCYFWIYSVLLLNLLVLFLNLLMLQPVPEKMRLEMLVGMQIEILNGGDIVVNQSNREFALH